MYLKEFDRAEECFEKALEIEPDYDNAKSAMKELAAARAAAP
jgi:hypothetical protein